LLLDEIIQSAGRMHEFVQAVLKFAQVGQGNIGWEPVEMDRVADAAIQSLQAPVQELRATILRDPLPTVLGDSVQIVQLLQNLIANALKYHRPDHPPEIAIRVSRDGEHCLFAVTDNGEGIAPEYLDHIFEPLKRLHGSEVPGTGLGLTICQRIAERHEGRIWAESSPGAGSTFYFTLRSA
jgi:signal transduction histidine kinase